MQLQIILYPHQMWGSSRIHIRSTALSHICQWYINLCDGNILSFEDDTTLYMSNSHLQSLYAQININNLFTWFCANKLSLYTNKTNYILIRPKQKRCDLSTSKIYINNMELNRIGHDCEEKVATFLGLFTDEYLTWQYQRHYITHWYTRISLTDCLLGECEKIDHS